MSLRHDLAELLSELAEQEKQVETLRLILTEQPDFEPYAAFRRLDAQTKDALTASDFKAFLHREEETREDQDYVNLARRYDSNKDGVVTYSDFLEAVLPRTSPALRAIATSRSQFLEGGMPEHVEYPLLRLMEKQMETIKVTDRGKTVLISKSGFSGMNAYESIDSTNIGYVTFEMLVSFFIRSGFREAEELSLYLFRLFDLNRDGRFTYMDFLEGLSPMDPGARLTATERLQRLSPAKRSQSVPRSRTPRRMQSASPSQKRKTTASHQNYGPVSTFLYETPQKKQSELKSKTPGAFLRESVRLRSTAKLNSGKMPKLAKILIEQLALEKELETHRQLLSLRVDFNIESLLRLFPSGNNGLIHIRSLSNFLQVLDVYPEPQELMLLAKVLDKDNDSWVSATDLSDALVPRQEEHRRVLQGRSSSHSFLSIETKEVLADMLRHLMSTELAAEILRERIFQHGLIDIGTAFAVLDRRGKGHLIVSDFRAFLQHHGHFLTEKELAGLMGRYDRNKDGKVTYAEFVEEVSPKL